MITVIGILIGAIIVALIWMCVYFNQEIHDVLAEVRAISGGYYKPSYSNSSYSETMARKERDEWRHKYEKLEREYNNLKIAYSNLAQDYGQEIEETEDDDELDN